MNTINSIVRICGWTLILSMMLYCQIGDKFVKPSDLSIIPTWYFSLFYYGVGALFVSHIVKYLNKKYIYHHLKKAYMFISEIITMILIVLIIKGMFEYYVIIQEKIFFRLFVCIILLQIFYFGDLLLVGIFNKKIVVEKSLTRTIIRRVVEIIIISLLLAIFFNSLVLSKSGFVVR